MAALISALRGSRARPNYNEEDDKPVEGLPVLTKYEFADVAIPDEFLTIFPADAQPITLKPVEWQPLLPENEGGYAVVLDNVLSPSECDALLRLAEASVPAEDRGKSGERFWRPALVNVGGGYEVLHSTYRNSDRIIWDEQTVMDRLWERCASVPEVRDRLAVIEDDPDILGRSKMWGPAEDLKPQRWEFLRLNKRMRFLKYGPGQFFKPHCDGAYREAGENGEEIKTLFTVHLYLNDSKAEVGDKADLVGGATSFLSGDEERKLDVDPKAGRVLIFQHSGLYHSGDEVKEGIKYTMRTDIMYKLVRQE